MQDAATAFARDRRRFLGLCEEILARLEEPQNDLMFSPVEQLIGELCALEIATRLGFVGKPLFFYTRSGRNDAIEHMYGSNDPYGGGGGEIHVYSFRKGADGVTRDVLDNSYRTQARREMHSIVTKWVRAVRDREMPTPYPALPPFMRAGTDPALSRDTFWRRLDEAIIYDIPRHVDAGGAWSLEAWPTWLGELNILAKYEGVAESGLFAVATKVGGYQVALTVEHPAGKKPVQLRFSEAGKLDEAGITKLTEHLTLWRDARADQLRKAGVLPGLRGVGNAKGARGAHEVRPRGSPRRFEPKEDQKLVADWQSSDMTQSEFEHKRGLDPRAVRQAQDRIKAAATRAPTNGD